MFLHKRLFAILFMVGALATATTLYIVHAASSGYTTNVATATVGTAMTNPAVLTYKVGDATAWSDTETLTVTLPANFPIWDSTTYTVTTGDGSSSSTLVAGVNYTDNNARLLTITEAVAPLAGTYIAVTVTAGLTPTYSDSTSDITFGGTSGESGTISVNVSNAASAPSLVLSGNSVVGGTGNSVFSITTPLNLGVGDYIQFSLPFNLTFSGTEAFVSTSFVGGGSFTCDGTSQILNCTSTGVITAGSGTITVSGVVPGYALSGGTISGSVAYSDNNLLATGTGGSVTDTTVAALTSASVTSSVFLTEATTQYTIGFTSTVTIPNLGKIAVTFPSGIIVSGVVGTTASSLSGLDGTWTAAASGQTVTFTQVGGGVSAAGAKSFVISGVKNPSTLGVTGSATITTKVAAGSSLETASAAGFNSLGISRTVSAPEVDITSSTSAGTLTLPTQLTAISTPIKPIPVPQPTEVVVPPKLTAPIPSPVVIVPQPTPAPVFTRILKMGSQGSDVRLIQTLLESQGFMIMPSGISKGYFGALTQTSLKKYQKALRVKQTGILDAATRAAIK